MLALKKVQQGYFFSISYMPMHDFIDCAQKEKDIAKCKKNQNAFTWLQACFLREVRVIWYKSLGDRHFQTNVIDDVGNLFDYYLYISHFLYLVHLLVAHTIRKSLLNSVHIIVYWLI